MPPEKSPQLHVSPEKSSQSHMGYILDKCPIAEKHVHPVYAHDLITVNLTLV